jgi:hypothetical protein
MEVSVKVEGPTRGDTRRSTNSVDAFGESGDSSLFVIEDSLL